MQRPDVVSKRKGYVELEGDVYVGRPSPWGNPFAIGKDGSRRDVIEQYRQWIADRPELVRQLWDEAPWRLVCWCAPAACHADVLADLLADAD